VNGYVKLLSRYGEIAKAWASEEGDQAAYMVALRRAPRILAAARVRNEEENLPAFFREVSEVADGVVILDDRSTDRTASLCAKEDLVVEYLRSDLPTTDEVRDKNRLLASVIEHDPDWVVAIDADERFEPGGAAYVKRLLTYAPPEATAYSFDAVHLWDTPVQARIDGLYGSSVRHPRVFHTQPVVDGALRFRASAHDAGLHCGSIPSDLAADAVPTPVRLLHLGYLDEHTREAKVAFYQREDPGQFAAGYYSHLSDASAQLVHILDRREALERAELWHSINHGVNLGRFASLAVLFVHADVEPSIAQAIRQQRPRYLVQIGGTSPHIWADAVYPNLREAMNAVEAKAFCVPLNLAASALTAAVRAGFPTTGVLALGQGRWSRRLASVVSRVRMQHRSDGGE
jgi:glycosyltransferase involved in cell wall biosynthesis